MSAITLPEGTKPLIGTGLVAGAGVAGYGAFRETQHLARGVESTVDGTLDIAPKLVNGINRLQNEGTEALGEIVGAMDDAKLGKGLFSKVPGLRKINALINDMAKLGAASRRIAKINERPLVQYMTEVTAQSERFQTEVIRDALELRGKVPGSAEKILKRGALAGVLGAVGGGLLLSSLVGFE